MFPIIIVDDSRQDLELAERVFVHANIVNPIHLLASGVACIDFLRKRHAETAVPQEPCLIFLDMAMPEMSGPQTIDCINQMAPRAKPWIIMLSGLTDVKMVRDGYQLGAKTFFTKPLTEDDLMRFVNNNISAIRLQMTPNGYALSWTSPSR